MTKIRTLKDAEQWASKHRVTLYRGVATNWEWEATRVTGAGREDVARGSSVVATARALAKIMEAKP